MLVWAKSRLPGGTGTTGSLRSPVSPVVLPDLGWKGVRPRRGRASLRIERAATFTSLWIAPYEDNLPIMVCRGIKKPLAELWPMVKSYR